MFAVLLGLFVALREFLLLGVVAVSLWDADAEGEVFLDAGTTTLLPAVDKAEGIAAAKARGVKFGRPVKKPPKNFQNLVVKWKQKMISVEDIPVGMRDV